MLIHYALNVHIFILEAVYPLKSLNLHRHELLLRLELHFEFIELESQPFLKASESIKVVLYIKLNIGLGIFNACQECNIFGIHFLQFFVHSLVQNILGGILSVSGDASTVEEDFQQFQYI